MATIAQLEAQVETLSRRNAELEQQLAKAESLAQKNETRAIQAEGAAEKAAIESHLRIAALEAGSTQEPTAGSAEGPLDSVVRRAMADEKWKVDSQGKLYRLGDDGEPVMTPTAYETPAVWMRQFRETLPGAFPKHQQGVQAAAQGSPGAAKNPWSREYWNITDQGHFMNDHGMDAANAAAAGSTVYAVSPPAPAGGYTRDDPQNPWSASGWNVTRQSRMIEINKREAGRMAEAAGSTLTATTPPTAR
jgi:hypothetical protein